MSEVRSQVQQPLEPAGAAHPGLTAIIEWFEREAREVPWRASRDRYEIWVAEVMSAQTTLSRAVTAWQAWIARWPDVGSLAAATLTEVLGQWQGLGYPRRARDLHRSARLIAVHGWPEDLTELPGVGPYVAAAIRCFALEQPVLPRDVNVNRVLARRFPAGVEIAADPWRAGQALMELGQRICRTRPACDRCPAAVGCPGPDEDAERRRRPRRQAAFEGSLRQRRGTLLACVIARGAVPREQADSEAAAGLVLDGLIVADGRWLRAPG